MSSEPPAPTPVATVLWALPGASTWGLERGPSGMPSLDFGVQEDGAGVPTFLGLPGASPEPCPSLVPRGWPAPKLPGAQDTHGSDSTVSLSAR